MKLNNKGFAISTVMYMILIMAVILITLTLSILSGRKLILDSETKEAKNNIYNVYDISYRQALEILKNEAVAYAQDNNIEKDSIKIGDFNSSIDNKILDGYKLTEKYLTIISTGDSYNIYLGKSKTITDISKTVNNLIDIVDYKISGNSYQKTYTGKNLFDFTKGTFTSSQSTMEKTNDGGYNITNLETTSSVAYNYSSLELSSGTYTASVKGLSGLGNNGYMQIVIDGNWSSTIDDNKSYTFTLTENKTIRVYISFSENQWTTGGVIYPQIEEGTIATSYEPYVGGEPSPNPEYPQDVQSVGEYDSTTGKYKIPVTVSGKNLFDVNSINLGTTSNITMENDTVSIKEGANNYTTATQKVYVSPSTKYTLSAKMTGENNSPHIAIGEFDKDGNNIKNNTIIYNLDSNENGKSFTTQAETSYIEVYLRNRNSSACKFENIQLELGATNTNYEPYYEPVTHNIILDEPLRKIGSDADYIDFNGKKLVRYVGTKELDGVTNGKMLKSYSRGGYIAIPDMKVVAAGKGIGFSSFAQATSVLVSEGIAFGWENTNVYFCYINGLTDYTQINALINELYLVGVDTNIYYQLASPKETSIDLPKLDIGIGNYKIEIGTNIKPSSVEFTVIQKIKQI